ncbi:hypothetical protein C8R43DRAFT_941191 [Mycena crocata]|nr:hypothetical protein C8R43DRAFT_941191 [Mycena crocata]
MIPKRRIVGGDLEEKGREILPLQCHLPHAAALYAAVSGSQFAAPTELVFNTVAGSVVLGSGSGPSPTQARVFKPDPGPTRRRAQVGLGSGLDFFQARDPGSGPGRLSPPYSFKFWSVSEPCPIKFKPPPLWFRPFFRINSGQDNFPLIEAHFLPTQLLGYTLFKC